MHESFNKDNQNEYSRSWFAWANTMYGHLVLKIYR
jgi:meiotically up-regulated gene 157 (Mug157) protein